MANNFCISELVILTPGLCRAGSGIIKYQVLHDMMNTEIEALWVKLRPSRLPRGISCIILCNLYHPPSGNDQQAINYLYESLTTIEANFPSCGIILLGDFNKLITSRLTNGFKLYQIVKFPTRGQNLLDLIFTNMKEFYKEPIKRPAFGLSDHDTIEVQPLERLQMPKPKLQVKSRDLKPTKRLAMSTFLKEVDIKSLIAMETTIDGKTQMLESIINFGLDSLIPFTTKTIYCNEPPWMSNLNL